MRAMKTSMHGHPGHHADPGHGPSVARSDGHDRHAGHSAEMFRSRFWVSLVLTIPVLAYADVLWEVVGLRPPQPPGSRWVPFLLATAIYVYGGSVFLRSSLGELRARRPGMMTLVSLGISVAYLYSATVTILFAESDGFYWELATLVTIMLLGHWVEMRSIGRASAALSELARLLPDSAERLGEHGPAA